MLSKLNPAFRTYDTILVVSVARLELVLQEKFAPRGGVFSTIQDLRDINRLPVGCNLVACLRSGLTYDDELFLKRLASQQNMQLVFCLNQQDIEHMLNLRLSVMAPQQQPTDTDEVSKRRFVEERAPAGMDFNIHAVAFRIKTEATKAGLIHLNHDHIAKILVGLKHRRKKKYQASSAQSVTASTEPSAPLMKRPAVKGTNKIEVPWAELEKAELINLPAPLRQRARVHSLRPKALPTYVERIYDPSLGLDLVRYAKTIYEVAVNNGFPAAQLGEIYVLVCKLHNKYIESCELENGEDSSQSA